MPRPRLPSKLRFRLALLPALVALLAGCGSTLRNGPAAHAAAAPAAPPCTGTVMGTLDSVLTRVYREGVLSERTASAEHLIAASLPLRAAIESGSPTAARAAARELVHTGHMTNLEVTVAGRRLVSVGGSAIAPLRGTILDTSGKPIASYLTSVWADSGYASEVSGVAEGLIALRVGSRQAGGDIELPRGALAPEGTLAVHGIDYAYSSIAVTLYPAGDAHVYLLKPLSAIASLCRASTRDTQVATLQRVADLIYEGEVGPRTLTQIRRVQRYQPLLAAVARRDPEGTREAVEALLHHHLVRLRVIAGGTPLADVGGPYVLAPVRAPLRLRGRQIGSIVLSIQDDEGYLRLTKRLAGLDVLMFMRGEHGAPTLVKNSLGPGVGPLSSIPATGSYSYEGREFQVFTVHAKAFPSGPLTIRVLVPEPYAALPAPAPVVPAVKPA